MTPGRLAAAVLAAAATLAQLLHVSVPEPGQFSDLMGTYCTSSASCWAVGSYGHDSTGLNEVLHWNGTRWRQVPAPSPAGTGSNDDSLLFAVRCARANDCWAVGAYQIKFGPSSGQALHWNGRKWTRVRTPEPGAGSGLTDVACASPANCWAVGTYQTSGPSFAYANEALHWNGTRWTLAGTPDPAGTGDRDINALYGVRCPSAATCMTVGFAGTTSIIVNQVLRLSGGKWSPVSVPDPGGTDTSGDRSQLRGLACSSVRNCWAVGSYAASGAPVIGLNQVLHWNGSAWSEVSVPEPGGTTGGASQELLFAACGSATNCWAVGDASAAASSRVTANQAMHWDGGMWSVVKTPDPAGLASGDVDQLNAVRCVTAANCWAVGTELAGSQVELGQVLHWGGSKWSVR